MLRDLPPPRLGLEAKALGVLVASLMAQINQRSDGFFVMEGTQDELELESKAAGVLVTHIAHAVAVIRF